MLHLLWTRYEALVHSLFCLCFSQLLRRFYFHLYLLVQEATLVWSGYLTDSVLRQNIFIVTWWRHLANLFFGASLDKVLAAWQYLSRLRFENFSRSLPIVVSYSSDGRESSITFTSKEAFKTRKRTDVVLKASAMYTLFQNSDVLYDVLSSERV